MHSSDWSRCNCSPYAVAIAFGTSLKLRECGMNAHILKMSSGMGGNSKSPTGRRKAESDTTSLVSARAPKYNATILFAAVIAYILVPNRISRSRDKIVAAYLSPMKTSEDDRRNEDMRNSA